MACGVKAPRWPVPIEFVAVDAAACRVTLANGGVDICVLDDALSGDDKAAVIRAA
jgi:hypothetical protein